MSCELCATDSTLGKIVKVCENCRARLRSTDKTKSTRTLHFEFAKGYRGIDIVFDETGQIEYFEYMTKKPYEIKRGI